MPDGMLERAGGKSVEKDLRPYSSNAPSPKSSLFFSPFSSFAHFKLFFSFVFWTQEKMGIGSEIQSKYDKGYGNSDRLAYKAGKTDNVRYN